jgi:predicted PurR-regulated permease PerM
MTPATDPHAEPPATLLAAPPPDSHRPPVIATQVIAVLMTVAMLYLAREVFVPFALAALLGFILDPLVTRLRRWGLPRAVAVVAVMAATVAVLGGTSLFVGGQVVQLSKNLPTYQTTAQQKLRGLRQYTAGRGTLDDATRMLDVVGGELDAAKHDLDGEDARHAKPPPLRVQVETPPRTALQTLVDWITPAMGPVGNAGIVLVFVVFMLLERNDLRDRLLRLVGGDLHRTTDALGEAGDRVSRYLTMQLLVNLSYGVPMALGLWAIGVPGAVLWGLLAALLRFVPYIGPFIAAVFPLTLAFAVDPGWGMVGWTLALVLTLEMVSNNLIEPWLYGASTGLSPVSIIVSAVVWTALWGPIGLILATPLTVCLAVLGRHLPQLRWLDVLLGNAPVFDPATRLYQRLLAGDVAEAIEMASDAAGADSVAGFYSSTAVPALCQAATDHSRVARIEHRLRVTSGMAALIADLRHDHPDGDGRAGTVPLLCIGARWEVDTLAADMLGHALALEGRANRVLPATAVSADHIQSLDLTGIQALCLSSFNDTPQAQVRYIARRLKRRQPGLQIVVGLWNAPPELLTPDIAHQLGVDGVANTLSEALARLTALVHDGAPAATPPAAEPGPHDAERVQALQDSGALEPALRSPLDRAAQRAADVFDVPLAMVSLVDDTCQIWQGAVGLEEHAPDAPRHMPREISLCGHVVAQDAPLVVEDTARDPRFAANPVLREVGVRFYAGAPLRTADGHVIGALCLLDHAPRHLSASELRLLQAMADDVMALVNTTGQALRQARLKAQTDAQGLAADRQAPGSPPLLGAPA